MITNLRPAYSRIAFAALDKLIEKAKSEIKNSEEKKSC